MVVVVVGGGLGGEMKRLPNQTERGENETERGENDRSCRGGRTDLMSRDNVSNCRYLGSFGAKEGSDWTEEESY